jgi:hypothetical protein
MSQENVEIVRALAEGFQRGDHERAFDFYDPEIEWDTGTEGVAPGMAGVYRGYEAFGISGGDGFPRGRTFDSRSKTYETRATKSSC